MELHFSRGLDDTAQTARPPHRELPLDDRPLDSFTRPISPARAALRSAQRALDAANTSLADASEPCTRLEEVIAAATACETELQDRHRAYHGRLGCWYAAGAEGQRPEPDAELLDCERRLGGRQADALAAQEVIADHRHRAQRAAEQVRDALLRRDDVLREAVKDAVRDYLHHTLQPAYAAAQEAELPIADLELHLAARDPALAAILREMAQQARARLTPPPTDAHRAATFVARLLEDVETEL